MATTEHLLDVTERLTRRGDQICSDIVHFDRMQLQPLMRQRPNAA